MLSSPNADFSNRLLEVYYGTIVPKRPMLLRWTVVADAIR